MGRPLDGGTPRERRVIFRLNREESEQLEEKRDRRGLGVSDYFRTVMKEDGDVQH